MFEAFDEYACTIDEMILPGGVGRQQPGQRRIGRRLETSTGSANRMSPGSLAEEITGYVSGESRPARVSPLSR